MICKNCDGSGLEREDKVCLYCNGFGTVEGEEEVTTEEESFSPSGETEEVVADLDAVIDHVVTANEVVANNLEGVVKAGDTIQIPVEEQPE